MFFNFGKKPVIHLYTICWNEEYMLRYFFRHYDSVVDRYIFFDNGSTDQTRPILEKHPKVEIRRLGHSPDKDSYVLDAQQVHNEGWKESRGLADWVIITAVDEFLYAPQFKAYLVDCARNGVTAIPALGFQMISRTRPSANKKLTDLVKRGCPFSMMNKLSLFDPNKIMETCQQPGRHTAGPSGEVKYPATDKLLNLHYQYLSFDHTFQRRGDLNKKLGAYDRERGWGREYGWTQEEFQRQWDYFEQHSIENVLARHYQPHLQHSSLSDRWWQAARSIAERSRTPPVAFPFSVWRKIPQSVRTPLNNFLPTKLALNALKRLFQQPSS